MSSYYSHHQGGGGGGSNRGPHYSANSYPSYPNYGYTTDSHHEMSEYNGKGTYSSRGSKDNVYSPYDSAIGISGGASHHVRTSSMAYGNGSRARAPPPPVDYEDEEEDRGHWGSKAEFLLSCIGFSVGIGNVWRFPYLAYSNGGGAFLLPYVILLIFVGKPLYYMETAMGQFSRTSSLHVWRCAPIMQGVGYAMIVLSLIVAIYYNVIMAYSIIYIGASFTGIANELPWTYCGEWWGADENCVVVSNVTDKSFVGLARCRPTLGITENCTKFQTSSEQFWEKYVLNITDGLGEFGDLGGFKYDLPLALLLSWIVVFLCLMKGVKSSGKVVYFTATFPYLILIALLVQGCLLPGAAEGLAYLFIPDFSKLLTVNPWIKAAEQMFFSLGISWGGLMMFGSYNKFHNRIDYDAAFVSVVDFCTSLIASVVIFSVLGFLAKELDVPVADVAKGGQGLAFVVYPEALARLPLPWLWAVLFFFMLFLLGLDSEFALLETVLTILYDGVPFFRRNKVKTTFVACSCCFLLGLPCVSFSGQFVLDIMDTYGAGFAVLWTAFWEVAGLMWVYGVMNVCKDFKLMLGSEPGWYWKICWAVISPIFLVVIFLTGIFTWEEHKYSDVVPYPSWASSIGWFLVALSAIQIPLWAIITTIHYAIKGKLSQVIKPTSAWGPGDKAVRRAILDEQSGIARTGKYTYDNDAMTYNYHM
ncbi:sodium-dependent proline transporter-like [Tigriopus californicus]|uniref:sodium-dependent proline transporter-like n=1 Tax=Tigriopus californicus TaxID=6832 RepID=UPI0027DA9428|nr:sodium-dependent proline transporter-like [Tigriopus californicus]